MRHTTIHQPATCSESWDDMTPTDVGRHCASCQTQVVDFTHMTDGEVVAFLSQYSPTRRCGLFREDQVDRQLIAAARPVIGWRRWAVTIVLLLWSVFGIKARAQNAKPKTKATKLTHATIPDSLFLIQGVASNWLGIHKAGVQVKMKGFRDFTDAKGHFRILIPKSAFRRIHYITLTGMVNSRRKSLEGRMLFDSTRTRPYRIKMHKVTWRTPGFF